MSNEIFSVSTLFADVATLAQGYMNRADGERLLLPLPIANRAGGGVRFVVYLADGTPAFAGAGLCVQASDQGTSVAPEQRYETLLDTLQFDERSRPVYDYIVAVRNAAYAQHQAASEGEAVDVETDAAASDAVQSYPPDESTAIVDADSLQPVADSLQPAADSYAPAPDVMSIPPASFAPSVPAYDEAPAASWTPPVDHPGLVPSFIPPPLPTGLLTRPPRTTHWQPAPPRRPTPRPASGMFRYRVGPLPVPSAPPRPDLDRSMWVTPATRPAQ